MNAGLRRKGPFWLAPESRIVRPELWGLAIVVVGMLLVEVWQSSRMTERCMALEQQRTILTQERSRLEYARVTFDRDLTGSQQEPRAARLGFVPMDGTQQIDLPAAYLASEGTAQTPVATSRMALLDRIAHALVPDATARSRSGS
jgi:hypothetical protein